MELDDWIWEGRLDDRFPMPTTAPFTRGMAEGEGLSGRDLTRLVQEGLLRRPVKGVYLATAAGDSLLLRARCLELVVPEDCVVVDRHAGWLVGAEMALAPGEHLELRPLTLFRPSGNGRVRNGIVRSGERWLRDVDIMEVGGLRVTTPIRTAWDLGRVRWPEPALAGIDQMLRLGDFGLDEFVAGIEQFRGQRWVTTLRAVGPLGDGRAESPPESILRLRCIENRLAMTPQVEVRRQGRFVARLDLASEELMAGAEYDGVEWHDSPEQRDRDRERRADAADGGWLIEVFVKENLFGHRADADAKLVRLRRRALARRGLRMAS